ncbi:hypothetical protein D3C80_728580 [compost metagenome]
MTGQQCLDPLADIHVGQLGAETEVELHLQFAGDDVGGAGPGLDVGYLEAGGGEVGVALIPDGGGELRQGRRRLVDGVVCQMRISHVALYPAYQQIAGDGAAAAVLHHVPYHCGGGGLADDAPADLLVARLQGVDDAHSAVDEGPLFIGGDEEGDGALMVRMLGHEALGGHHHGGQRSLHVGGAAAIEHAILDGRLERRGVPLLQRPGGHHVGVAGEAEQRPLAATAGPEVGGVFKHHGLDDEPEALEALRHQGLAPFVQRGN